MATSGGPVRSRPRAGREVAISTRPPAISNPAIRFRLIAPIIVSRNREPVKKRREVRENEEGAGFEARRPLCAVWLRGLAGGRTGVGLANGLGERPARL